MRAKEKGVTLVALTVTIIVLAILVGISLNVVVGDNGLINRAKKVSDDADQVKAKEKLQLELANLSGDKLTDKTYDEQDYINNRLISKDMQVYENFVVVDDWLFEIDRSEPKIKEELGRSTISEDIQIEPVKEISGDYGEASIIARVIYNKGTISKITIGGEDVASVVNNGAGKFEGTKKVTENGKYTIIAVDTKGKMQIANIDLTELTTDLEIRTKEDMEKFRNDVNSGKTYEGKNVKVMADIDLGLKNNESWEPIKGFKGNFYGNNYKIKNLYINKNEDNQGLFAKVNENSSVKDLTIESGVITNQGSKTGAIAGSSEGTIENCENKIRVNGNKLVGGIVGSVEKSGSVITNCRNSGDIYSYNYSASSSASGAFDNMLEDEYYVGGVIGKTEKGINVSECVNSGNIYARDIAGGVIGVANGNIDMCENFGIVTCNGWIAGGIVGISEGGTISKCYCNKSVTASTAVGGICGGGYGQILYSGYKGTVNIKRISGSYGVIGGGIVAFVHGTGNNSLNISYCYSNCSITLPSTGLWSGYGGICGISDTSTNWADSPKFFKGETSVNISNSYSFFSSGAGNEYEHSGGILR